MDLLSLFWTPILVIILQNIIFLKLVQDILFSLLFAILILRKNNYKFVNLVLIWSSITAVNIFGFILCSYIFYGIFGVLNHAVLTGDFLYTVDLYRAIYISVNIATSVITATVLYKIFKRKVTNKKYLITMSLVIGLISAHWLNVIFPVSSFF